MSVKPRYAVTSIGSSDRSWRIYLQDCLTGVPQRVQRGLPTLCAADAPYNIGQPYLDYDDTKTQAEYLDFLAHRIEVTRQHMHPHGSMWVAMNTINVSEVDVMCKKLGLFPRSQVCWFYSFGQNSSNNLTPSHVTWLYFTLHRTKFIFNADAIRVPSARQLIYNDKRANPKGRLPDDVWVLLPAQEPALFKPLDDTWLYSRICGTFKEKIKTSPNQMPVAMMDRIVRLCSNPGDTVLDIFGGTFTTGEAAVRAGRKFIGFDISPACVKEGERRLSAAVTKKEA